MSLLVDGLLVGVVDWASDPIADGVIPLHCLEQLGWAHRRATVIEKAPDQLWRTLVADRGPQGAPVPVYYHRACLYCLLNRTPNGHINTEKLLQDNDLKDDRSIVQDYVERVRAVTWNRVILQGSAEAERGSPEKLVGLGPPKTQDGDVIAIFYGCSVPVILRPWPQLSENPERYEFIGEAYIYGKMDGEAMFDGHIEKTFRLQ